MAPTIVPNAEEVDKQLAVEFSDEIGDAIAHMEVGLGGVRSGGADPLEALNELRRTVLNLVTQGRGLDLPLINLTLHQLYDYLMPLSTLGDRQVRDVEIHLEKLTDIREGRITEASNSAAELVRELPIKSGFDVDFGDITPENIQILVIVPEKAMSHIIEREMAACGIRTTNLRNPFQAFEMAHRIKPDMIIASRELTADVNGIDLACAFAAMETTREIPFGLLSSYDWGHAALNGLPQRAALLKKGASFGEDLAEALQRYNIF